MNEVWNLDPIYRGFDDPAFTADMDTLREKAAQYNAFAAELPNLDAGEGLRRGIEWEETLTALARKLAFYCQLRQSVNTRDPECGSRLGQVMQVLSSTAGAEAAWKQWAAGQDGLMELVKGDETLKEYEFLFENLLRDSTHLLGSLGEEICARMEVC